LTAQTIERHIRSLKLIFERRTPMRRASLVFGAWTNPKHVVQWWGTERFHYDDRKRWTCDRAARGKHIMHGPDGKDYPNKSVFLEVVKNRSGSFYAHTGGRKGDPGAQFQTTVTFDEFNGGGNKRN